MYYLIYKCILFIGYLTLNNLLNICVHSCPIGLLSYFQRIDHVLLLNIINIEVSQENCLFILN